MATKKNKSSFQKLPPQIEWAMPFMIAFVTYVIYHKSGIVLAVSITTFAIMLNGWISSKATGDLYSDDLLAIDVIALCMYMCMSLSLLYSSEILEPKYHLYSGLLCFSYMIWDILIKTLIPLELWKKYFKRYVFFMGGCGVLHVSFFFLSVYTSINQIIIAIASMILWTLTLGKWHYDKIQMNKKNEQ